MKILHVITSLRTGGAEKLMVDMLPRMNALGVEVDLCVFDGVRTPFYEELEKKGVKIIPLGHSVYSLVNIWGLLKLMRTYDVVHTHNTPAQLCAAIANLFVQTRLITTEHSTNNRRRGKKWLKPLDLFPGIAQRCRQCNSSMAQCFSKRTDKFHTSSLRELHHLQIDGGL